MLSLINSQADFPIPASKVELTGNVQSLKDALAAFDAPLAAEAWMILADAKVTRLIEGIFGSSPFLSSLIIRNAEFLPELFSRDPSAILGGLIAEVNTAEFTDIHKLKKYLRQAKGKVALVTALADLAGVWSLGWVTSYLSSFADSAVKAAVRFLLRQAAMEGLMTAKSRSDPVGSSGLIVLGMGKLGALELNYSSDIDLIVFFDGERANKTNINNPQKFFVKLARDLVAILSDRTEDGYVFRTDLRLRPDPSSTPVAMSTSGALTYYETVGQNWERAAMIKARQIAGDMVAGDEFLKNLIPYVWRRNLDFAAIRDIHSIKRQMDARLDAAPDSIKGFNVKLGSGGIREIEFFVQTQQLIWGGKQPTLRVKSTCEALIVLSDLGHITPKARDALTQNYHELRRIEHRLQMVADAQTHNVPESDEDLKRVAMFSGFETVAKFEQRLKKITSETHRKYTQIFKDEKALSEGGNLVFTGVENDAATLETLRRMGYRNPEYVSSAIRAWHHGSRRATRTKKARELITELVPSLLKTFAALPEPDESFRVFDDLVAGLPAVSQIFMLFTSSPQLLELIANVLGNSPYLTEFLRRKPARIDAMLYPRFFAALPPEEEIFSELAALTAVARDYEEKLDVAKRYVQERQLQVGVHLLKGLATPEEARCFLSSAADIALKSFLETVSVEFHETYGGFDDSFFGIIGMGKLGGHELGFKSDLDLVFVYDTGDESQHSSGSKTFQPNVYYMRLAQRVLGALSGVSDEGRLYEIDTRLRPHGNKGPIAVSLSGFRHYYENEVWPVELLALTRARAVCLEDMGNAKLDLAIREVLARKIDKAVLAGQIKELRAKIAMQHPTVNWWSVKYAKGGLLDAEFIIQFLVLTAYKTTTPHGTLEQVQWLIQLGVLSEKDGKTIANALQLYRDFQMVRQLTEQPDGRISSIVLTALGMKSAEELEEKLHTCRESVYMLSTQVFGQT